MDTHKILYNYFFIACALLTSLSFPFSSSLNTPVNPPESSHSSPGPAPSTPQPPLPPPMPSPVPPSRGVKGGYWPSWLAEKNPPSTIPTKYFTHLFYAFVSLNASTYQLSITQFDDQWMSNFTATLHDDAKNNPRPAKAFLSIGGGLSSSYTLSNMAKTTQNRSTFVSSTSQVARKYSFDGLDLDWEFPKNEQEMSNLALLFKQWRAAVEFESELYGKPRLLLSAAVYFSPEFFLSDVPRIYPGVAIRSYVDFVNQMCYDYHGSWDTSVTGEHALVYSNSNRITTSYGVDSWAFQEVPPEKLVISLPLYGRTWKLKDPKQNGVGAPAVGRTTTWDLANDATLVYVEYSIAMYSYARTDWIGYDGPISIRKKIEYAKHEGLGRYFLWALGYDKNWTLSTSSAWDGR
ncbi:hypothetical protein ACOSQ3_012605 [Xanthoceras sorbifolium]